MEIPVITPIIETLTDDVLSYLTFGSAIYMVIIGIVVPQWLVPILVLQAKFYWDRNTKSELKTTFDED